jgi:hypothetical protein
MSNTASSANTGLPNSKDDRGAAQRQSDFEQIQRDRPARDRFDQLYFEWLRARASEADPAADENDVAAGKRPTLLTTPRAPF